MVPGGGAGQTSAMTDRRRAPGRAVRARVRDQRGVSLTAFTAVVMVALILMVGLVVDGGARSAAQRRAESVASAAARAALDAGSGERLAGGTGAMAGVQAGQAVIADSGLQGEVSIDGDRATARVRGTVSTAFLGLIGVNTLSVSATATAQLREQGR